MREVRVLERPLRVLPRQAQFHRSGVVSLQLGPRIGGEARELVHRHVDLHDPRPRLPPLDVEDELCGELLAFEQPEERDLGMDAADHDRRTELFAGRERDTDGASVVDEDPVDPGVRPDLAAERDSRGPDRIGDRPHPALRVSPVDGVAGASDAPDRVVQQDVGAPGLVGARPLPDQPVDHHDRLHLIRFEPAIEQLREAHREQPGRVGDASRSPAAASTTAPSSARADRRTSPTRRSAGPRAAAGPRPP